MFVTASSRGSADWRMTPRAFLVVTATLPSRCWRRAAMASGVKPVIVCGAVPDALAEEPIRRNEGGADAGERAAELARVRLAAAGDARHGAQRRDGRLGIAESTAGGEVGPTGGDWQRHAPHARPSAHEAWAFVYIFFTNGIPFDSPNRSEPCPGR